MKVEPGAADLLATARATLLEEIAPTLAQPQRYAVLMAANALAIAGRDLAAASAAGLFRSAIATLAPSRANSPAISLPMPLAAPVTMADLSLSFMVLLSVGEMVVNDGAQASPRSAVQRRTSSQVRKVTMKQSRLPNSVAGASPGRAGRRTRAPRPQARCEHAVGGALPLHLRDHVVHDQRMFVLRTE